jgi:release factor glutamine methyltransferase
MSATARLPVEAVTALDYLRRATDFLAARGVANARLDAEVLLADVLGVDRVGVYLNFDRPLSVAEISGYREAIRRRGRRHPLQHLRGRQEFWSREFVVDARALVPRADTEILLEAALEDARRRERPRILDLGTGSGILAVTLALELPEATVVAVDRSTDALDLARENAARLGARVEFREGDLFAPVASESFDLVASNPPYVARAEIERLEPEVRDHEPRLALDGGHDGLEVIRRIVAEAPSRLVPGGTLLLEIGAGQKGAVAALLRDAGFVAIESRLDLSGIDRTLVARRAGAEATPAETSLPLSPDRGAGDRR